MRTSRSPTTVMTANGEVQTREEATVYVKQLDLFVKFMLLVETPAVLSLGKLCDDHGYTYHWTSGQKPHLTKKAKRIDCNISNYVPFVVPGLSTSPLRRPRKSSHELPMEPRAKVEPVSGEHSIFSHFPKDPNCDICLKTKIMRSSCRRRTGTVVPRAENFGDLITADHKVLS